MSGRRAAAAVIVVVALVLGALIAVLQQENSDTVDGARSDGSGRASTPGAQGGRRGSGRPVELGGTVVDARTQAPRAGITVIATDIAGDSVATATTDDAGAFTLTVTTAAQAVTLSASIAEHFSTRHRLTFIRGTPDPVRIAVISWGRIAGTITRDGAPVPEVAIIAQRLDRPTPTRDMPALESTASLGVLGPNARIAPMPHPPNPLARDGLLHTRVVLTARDGRYSLALGAGRYAIHVTDARARGTEPPAMLTLTLAPGETTPFTLSLGSSARIAGRVVDRYAPDKGVAEAMLVALTVPERDGDRERVVGRTTANASGEFTMSVSRAGPVTLSVAAAYYRGQRQALTLVAGQTRTVTVSLDPGAVLEGAVTSTDGSALSGRTVRALWLEGAAPDAAPELTRGLLTHSVTSDAAGRYRLAGMRPGTYRLWVNVRESDDGDPTSALANQAILDVPLGITRHDFVLEQATRLLVTLAPRGGAALPPITHVEVRWDEARTPYPLRPLRAGATPDPRTDPDSLWTPVRGRLFGAPTDTPGQYEFRGVHPGPYLVIVRFQDTFAAPDDPPVAAHLDVPARSLFEARVSIDVGASISGHVTAPSGDPVAGATIMVMPPDAAAGASNSARAGSYVLTTTDDEGAYAIQAVVPGAWVVHVQATGFAHAARAVTVRDAAVVADFRLATGAVLRGIVRTPAGEPAVGVPLTLLPEATVSGMTLESPVVTTGADGRFEARGLTPGVYRFAIYDSAHFLIAGPETAEAPNATPIELVVARGVAVTGIVRDEGGEPVPLASLRFTPVDASDAPLPRPARARVVLADAEGRFTFAALPPGRYEVRVEHATRPVHIEFAQVASGGSMFEFVTSNGATLRGRVRWLDGQARAGWSIRLIRADDTPEAIQLRGERAVAVASIGEDGTFVVTGLPHAPWNISIHDALRLEQWRRESPLNIGGDVEDLDIAIADPSRGTLHITLSLPDGAVGANVSVTVVSMERGAPIGTYTADDTGTVRVTGLPVGRYRLDVRSGDGRRAACDPSHIDVADGDDRARDVRITALSQGVVVVDVTADSAAERGGLRTGDIVWRYAGERVDTPDALYALAHRHRTDAGTQSVEIHRGSRVLVLSIDSGPIGIQAEAAPPPGNSD